MELQSANLNMNSTASLAMNDSGQRLESASHITQSLQSPGHELERADNQLASPIESSSVVTQLVIGAEAAVAVYNHLVSVPADGRQYSQSASQISAQSSSIASQGSELKAELEVELEQAEIKVSQQLASIDREVRAHEQTHAAVGGVYAGAPSFSFTSGPNGAQYATSGSVSIDTSAVKNDPKATLEKAEVIIRAALSVTDPSAADRQIAAQAKSMALKAISEIRESSDASSGVESTGVRDAQLRVEQDQLNRSEYLADQELKEAKRERNSALAETRRQSIESSIAVLQEYNAKVSEIKDTLRDINIQLASPSDFLPSFFDSYLIDQKA